MEEQNSYLGTEEAPVFAPTSDEKTMALLSHVLTLVAGFIAPLIIYLIKKDESFSFAALHAKESLNFQITLFVVFLILFVSVVGILIMWIAGMLAAVLVIIATLRASEGKLYKYPFNIRLVK
jgi:uncharacterized Tic20 family protein